jgi:hypothetical protein
MAKGKKRRVVKARTRKETAINGAAKEEKINAPTKTGKKLSKEEKQVLLVIAFMVIAFLAFLLFFFIFKNAGTFVYEGIKFKKTSSEGLTLYYGKVGMKTSAGTFNYNLYLRNDPRKLADIPANVSVILRKTGYISFEPEISSCYGSSLAAYELASLLSALGMQVKGATTSHQVAIDEGIAERDCADAVNKTIIVLQRANETSIEQKGDCYKINIANCDAIGASEAFILAILKSLWNIVAS